MVSSSLLRLQRGVRQGIVVPVSSWVKMVTEQGDLFEVMARGAYHFWPSVKSPHMESVTTFSSPCITLIYLWSQ